MGNSVKNIKLTIGGPEATPGTGVALTHVIPISGVPSINASVERAPDPAIVGSNMITNEFTMAKPVAGSLPLSFRPCAGIGKLLKSLLGTESTPARIAGVIRIRYTGTESSCKLEVSATDITAEIGDIGDESADASFGSTGVLDMTSMTIAQVVAAIEAYANYDAQLVTGSGAADADGIVISAVQAAGKWAYIFFSSAAGTVYKHSFTPDLTNTERPTYTIQKDGFQDNFLYDGIVVDAFSLSAALKGMVEASTDLLGFSEIAGQSAQTSLVPEDIDPLIFAYGSVSLGEKEYTYTRNLSLNVKNNHAAEGYGQGSIERQYQQKGMFEVEGDLQVRLDADSYAERAKVFSGEQASVSFYFKGKTIESGISELVIIEIPYVSLSNFDFAENSDVFDAKMNFKALNPKGTKYDGPFTIHILTTDTGAY